MRFTIHLAIVIVIVIVQSANENGNQNEWTIACPCGLISMWYGSTDYPVGYQLCDGTNGTPDLKGKFIIGSSDGFEAGSTGGSNEITIGIDNLPAHDHGVGTIATSENELEGSHTHDISGTATAIEDTKHSHALTSNALISNEAAHTHVIPSLKVTDDAGHSHEVGGSTPTNDDASHTHEMNFESQNEKTPHTHTIPAHDTTGKKDGKHSHFIFAYQDGTEGDGPIFGVTYETIGAEEEDGSEIDTEGGVDDGIHGHHIDAQTTNTNTGHIHQILGSTKDGDGDHSHNIEGSTTGDEDDGVHYHTTIENETGPEGEHGHTISGNTENDGSHTHDIEGVTTGDEDGVHGHKLVGTTKKTGKGEAIEYYPPYIAVQFICCVRAGPTKK
eukprot:577733_1